MPLARRRGFALLSVFVVTSLIFIVAMLMLISTPVPAQGSNLQRVAPVKAVAMPKAALQQQAAPPYVLPCDPEINDEGTFLRLDCTEERNNQFTWEEPARIMISDDISVPLTTTCPVNTVLRSPYPRAMVAVTTTFTLSDDLYSPNEEGIWSDPVTPHKDVNYSPSALGNQWRRLQIGLRSKRLYNQENWLGDTAPEPVWQFEDRSWNIPAHFPVAQTGPTTNYIYETSSAGLPEYGRAFDQDNSRPADAYDLPAYSIDISTSCGHEWALRWQELLSNTGPSGVTFYWEDKEIDWQPIDLATITDTLLSTSYAVQTQTLSGGQFQGQTYWDAPEAIWVPVIEVQTVMRGQCVETGVCPTPDPTP